MSAKRALHNLGDLHRLGRVVHIAGGECMMYWEELREILDRACRKGLSPHFIETNCSFATDDAIVRRRLSFLQECGVVGILLSTDPYHQEFVPAESFLRVRRLGEEIFGGRNLWCSRAPDDAIRGYAGVAANSRLLEEHVRNRRPVMVGTARRELRRYAPTVLPAELVPEAPWRPGNSGLDCAGEFDRDRIWEIHIDPYDNIQTNCGVLLGNTRRDSVVEVLERGPSRANIIAGMLAESGPLGLAEYARDRHGYEIPESVAGKCDLCCDVRTFLRRFHPDILGPSEVYDA